MIDRLQAYYLQKEEPLKGCLLALRDFILHYHPEISESWTYQMPMFRYRGQLFCYLWIDKKTKEPYIGIYKGREIDHPRLVQGNRRKIKVIYIDPGQDLPIDALVEIFDQALPFYEASSDK